MLRGGDIKNSTETLKTVLKKIKYNNALSFEDISNNNPCIFLQIAHYVLVDYNPSYYKILVDKNYELYSKNDLRFVEQVYKLLFKEFNYKPSINIQQFLSDGYLEHKVILMIDIVQFVLKQNVELQSKSDNKKIYEANKENISQNQPQKQQKQKKKQQQVVIADHFCQDNFDEEEEIVPLPKPTPIIKEDPIQIKEEISIQQESYTQAQPMAKPQKEQNYLTFLNDSNDKQSQQQQYATKQEMDNLVEVVKISNQNVQMIMQKLDQFQTEISKVLNNFNNRIISIEKIINQ